MPKVQGTVVGCKTKGKHTYALIDDGDVHTMMIGAAGCGKTAFFLYPNIEAACASGMSFLQTDLKGDVARNYGTIAKKYYGYNVSVIDLRNPTRSDENNMLYLKRDKNGVLKREFNGRVMMYVPKEKWVGKLLEYRAMKIVKDKEGKEIWKTMHRGKLINLPDISIITRYNSEIRGLYNYYCMANNVSVLNKFYYIMEYSMYKTFAGKYRTTMRKKINKYKENNVFTVPYDTKSGKRYCEFYHDGFKRRKQTSLDIDTMPAYRQYERPNYLALRLKSGKCELCKCQSKALIMHHVRELKELSGNLEWENIMLNKRRKSLAVCKDCFDYICSTK